MSDQTEAVAEFLARLGPDPVPPPSPSFPGISHINPQFIPPMTAIMADACAATGITHAELISEGKERRLSHIRYAIAWAAHEGLGFAHSRIARSLYPNGSHTASMNACRRADWLMTENPSFARLARKLAARASERLFAM